MLLYTNQANDYCWYSQKVFTASEEIVLNGLFYEHFLTAVYKHGRMWYTDSNEEGHLKRKRRYLAKKGLPSARCTNHSSCRAGVWITFLQRFAARQGAFLMQKPHKKRKTRAKMGSKRLCPIRTNLIKNAAKSRFCSPVWPLKHRIFNGFASG